MSENLTPNITWVTYWIDIRRPYQDDRMFEAVKNLVKLPIQLVVYLIKPTESNYSSEQTIETSIQKKDSLSQQIIQLLNQKSQESSLLQIRYLDKLFYQIEPDKLNQLYQANRNPHFSGQKDTPEYCQLMWNKFAILADLAYNNPFTDLSNPSVQAIGWIDLGLGRICQLKEHSFRRINQWVIAKTGKKNKLDKKIRLCLIKRPPDLIDNGKFYQITHGYMVCGLMISNSVGWTHLNELFRNELDQLIQEQIITLEEKIIVRIFQKHPNLFSLHYGDYHDSLNNFTTIEQNFDFLIHFLKDEILSPLSLKRAKSLWNCFTFHKWNLSLTQQLDILIRGCFAAHFNQRYDWFWRFSCALEERISGSAGEIVSLKSRSDFQELLKLTPIGSQLSLSTFMVSSSINSSISSSKNSSIEAPILFEIIINYPDQAVNLLADRLVNKGYKVKIWNMVQTTQLKWSNPSYHQSSESYNKQTDDTPEKYFSVYRYDPTYLSETYNLQLDDQEHQVIRVSWGKLFEMGTL